MRPGPRGLCVQRKPKWYHWRRGWGEIGTECSQELWVMECRLLTILPFHSCYYRSVSDQEETRWAKAVLRTPKTHLILCLVLSAMLLLTFIFLLTLAIITPLITILPPFTVYPALSLRCPSRAVALLFLSASSPLSYIQMVDNSFPVSSPVSCQNQPSTQPPRSGKPRQILTSSKMKFQDSPQSSLTQWRYPGIWEWCNWNQMEAPLSLLS